MAGVVLGYRAIWHDRGPGGRHDFSGRSRGRGHPQPQTGLDRKWRVGPPPPCHDQNGILTSIALIYYRRMLGLSNTL